MGWETINGRRYFYETTYVDGERVRHCWGQGKQAEDAAARVHQEKQERARDLARVRALKIYDQRVDHMVATFDAIVRQSLQQTLNPTGYHYLRGQWRKRRSK